jgi:hypothetical protein
MSKANEETADRHLKHVLLLLALELSLRNVLQRGLKTLTATLAALPLTEKIATKQEIASLRAKIQSRSGVSFLQLGEDAERRVRAKLERIAKEMGLPAEIYSAWAVRFIIQEWKLLSGLYSARVMNEIFSGMTKMKNRQTIAADVLAIPYAHHVDTLTRTQIFRAYAEVMRRNFLENRDKYAGIQQISVLDERTSAVCQRYHGATWDVNLQPFLGNELPYDGGVPRHVNCRSVEIPLIDPEKLPYRSLKEWSGVLSNEEIWKMARRMR